MTTDERLMEIEALVPLLSQEWEEGNCPKCTHAVQAHEGCDEEGICDSCAQDAMRHIPYLLALVKRQREALEACVNAFNPLMAGLDDQHANDNVFRGKILTIQRNAREALAFNPEQCKPS